MRTGAGLSRQIFERAARVGYLRGPLFRAYDWALRRNRPYLKFDQALGIDTRGFLPNHALQSGKPEDGMSVAYTGVMPSVMRAALARAPDAINTHFIDIGAGKGRALAVASEFPFASITGVELNPGLCAIARKHAAIIARAHPERTLIRVVEGDASQPQLPVDGQILAFAYHPFGAVLMRKLADHLAAAARPAILAYVNPVHHAALDSHPAFQRVFAAQIPYDADERAASADSDDCVAIWCAGAALAPSLEGAAAEFKTITEGWRVALA